MVQDAVTHGKIRDVYTKSSEASERTVECTKPCPGELATTQLRFLREDTAVRGHFDKCPDQKG